MKQNTLVSGIVMMVLGVLIAIFGGESVLDIYFGIVALISGVCLLGMGIYSMSKKVPVAPSPVLLGAVLMAVGITLFTNFLSVAILINLLVIVVLGVGVGLAIYGCYLLSKRMNTPGLMNLVVGIACIVLAVLFIAVDGFRSAFWIIVGVVIAAYGLVETIYGLKK